MGRRNPPPAPAGRRALKGGSRSGTPPRAPRDDVPPGIQSLLDPLPSLPKKDLVPLLREFPEPHFGLVVEHGGGLTQSAPRDAIRLLEACLEALGSGGCPDCRAFAHFYLGEAHLSAHRPAEALRWHEAALALFRGLGGWAGEEEVRALTRVGTEFLALRKYDEALPPLEEALRLSRRRGNREGEANASWGLGQLHAVTRRFPDAREHYRRALVLFRQLKDAVEEARVRRSIAEVDLAEERFDEALRGFEEALQADERLNPPMAPKDILGIAEVKWARGNREGALECFEMAAGLYDLLESPREEADVRHRMGELHLEEKQFEEGTRSLERAARLYRRAGDRGSEAEAFARLCTAYQARGDSQKALAYARRAAEADPKGLEQMVDDARGTLYGTDEGSNPMFG